MQLNLDINYLITELIRVVDSAQVVGSQSGVGGTLKGCGPETFPARVRKLEAQKVVVSLPDTE